MDHTVADTRLFFLAQPMTKKKKTLKKTLHYRSAKIIYYSKNISTFNLGKKCALTLSTRTKRTSPGLWASDYQITLTAESVFHDNKQAIDK